MVCFIPPIARTNIVRTLLLTIDNITSAKGVEFLSSEMESGMQPEKILFEDDRDIPKTDKILQRYRSLDRSFIG